MTKSIVRTCTVCGQEKPANRANYHANGRGGYRGECSACWQFKNAALHANYRAKLLGQTERLSPQDIQSAYAAAAGYCYWTQAPLGSAWQLDHIIPLSSGGRNTPDNICITTAKTNRRKGSKVLMTWLSELAAHGYEHELAAGLELPKQLELPIAA